MVIFVTIEYRKILNMSLETGAKAPQFMLYDTAKKKVSLSDYQGKNVILLFFPFAFSSTCTKEVCEMRDNYSYYEKFNAEVIGISVDSLYANAKFKEVYELNFPLLSDFNKEVSAAYDSLLENFGYGYRGVSKRSTFVIDKEGNIAYKEILPSPEDYPDMQKLKEVIASLN
jgi:peroxiredoxin